MGKIGARKNMIFKAVSTAPSFNKTPVGSSTPPIAYPTTQDLSNSVSVAATVRFNGDPAYVLDKTKQPSCKGDDPGVAKGIRSNTVNGYVKPTGSALHFRAEKKFVVRHGDPNVMNGGNNPGIYLTSQVATPAAGDVATDSTSPEISPETPAENSFLASQRPPSVSTTDSFLNTGKLLSLAVDAAIAAKNAKVSKTPSAPLSSLAFIPGKKG
ncbi:DUF4150 domain-containing protein [Massilia sp. CCM 9210]|uniref:DUF4150 domain-containing protein n=1 Tax=Massilia scottii TaxID=3057166 RepID=UPI0027969972|nr:DUF4150 domain-containing protein [Massilia sp. CCM 9210]MDQ1817205.1 DUF4150 domain-containing protein [Massilia sp. CCM 9210]